ncbi:MAG: ATP synthase F1 subunit delta [Actinomycetota bacterium]|nr:ATP synthase F1 subunit delta [Actinomycetota bacterium]PLS76808.1 MAG: ATP synthase F1 subunit delta [Actinomycetota bacterium]
MSTESRVDAYASALFEVARAEGALETVEEELFRVARTFEASDELRSTLTDQAIPVERRQAVVEQLLGGRASPVTTALVSFVVGAGRARDLPAIIDRLVEEAAEQRAEVVAEVRSAVPLDESRRSRLAAALSDATKKQVSVKVVVDPSVLGGLVATIGDTVIDGSIRHRLDQMKETL